MYIVIQSHITEYQSQFESAESKSTIKSTWDMSKVYNLNPDPNPQGSGPCMRFLDIQPSHLVG